MYAPDAEDLLDQHEARTGARLRRPHVHVHVADVARHGDGRRSGHGRNPGTRLHPALRLAAPVAWRAVRLEEFDYDLPADRIAQVPLEPRDAARLLVDRGSAPPDAPRRARSPRPAPTRRPARRQRDQGDPGPARLTAPHRGSRRGAAARTDSTAAPAWEALVRPARKMRAGEALLAADGRGDRQDRGAHRGRRHVDRRTARTGRRPRVARPARRDAAPAVHHPPPRRPTATRRSTPGSRARRPHRRPGCTSHPSCWIGWRRAGSSTRRSSWSSGSTRSNR